MPATPKSVHLVLLPFFPLVHMMQPTPSSRFHQLLTVLFFSFSFPVTSYHLLPDSAAYASNSVGRKVVLSAVQSTTRVPGEGSVPALSLELELGVVLLAQ